MEVSLINSNNEVLHFSYSILGVSILRPFAMPGDQKKALDVGCASGCCG